MTEVEKRRLVFEQMPVHRAVISQVIPAIASQMITLIYNLVDTYFVGMLNDPRQTAAVTVVSSSCVMFTAISNLFGIGGASLIAQSLGRKEEETARRLSTISILGGMVSAGLFSLLFFLFSRPILYVCGATDEIYALAYGYAKWVVIIGGPVNIMNSLLANLLRAEGRAINASFGVSLGGVINIVLDPLFVLPGFLGYGAIGAGMATALSTLVGTAYFLLCLTDSKKTTVIAFRLSDIQYTGKHIKGILRIGFPSGIQMGLTVVAITALMNTVSDYGTEAIAALGIVRKLDQLPLYFSLGVANGLLPLLAYNYASGNQTRRHRCFQTGCGISLGFALLCVVLFEAFAPALTGLFIEEPLTRTYSAAFLRIMVLAMPMMSLCNPMITQFQAMGRVKESLICSVLRKGVLDIPLLTLMDSLIPLYGCTMVQPIVDTISLVVALIFYRRINQQIKKGI